MTSEEYWFSRQADYPARVYQKELGKDATRPEQVSPTIGPFIRIPIVIQRPNGLKPGVYWGFPTIAARTAFLAAYGGTAID